MKKAGKNVAGRGGGMRKAATQKANAKAQQGGRYLQVPDGVKFLKVDKGGLRRFDILPYVVTVKNHPERIEVGDLWYQRAFSIHRNIGVERNSYVCPRSVGKGKCPICEARSDAMKNQDEETSRALKASERSLFNVIDKGSPDNSIHIWDFSYYLFEKLLDAELRAMEEDTDTDPDWFFASLKGGSTIKVRFTEESMGKANFRDAEKIDFKTRDDYEESILENTVDLDKALIVLSYDELNRIFLDLDAETKENSEPEEEPPESGREQRQMADSEEEPESEKPKKKKKCPHGYIFRNNYDEYPECDECVLRKKCGKKK